MCVVLGENTLCLAQINDYWYYETAVSLMIDDGFSGIYNGI